MSSSRRCILPLGAFLLVMAACGGPEAFDNLPSRGATALGGSSRPQVAWTHGGANLGGHSGSNGSRALGGSPNRTGSSDTLSASARGGSDSQGNTGSAGLAALAKGGSGGSRAAAGGVAAGGRTGVSAGSGAPWGGGSSGDAPLSGSAGASEEQAGTRGTLDTAGASGAGGMPSDAPRPLPFFSEYVEGISSDKALEVVAKEATSLSGCAVRVYSNGALSPSHTIDLTETISFSTPLVICTQKLAAAASLAGHDAACGRIEALSFNGNDAVLLVCNGAVVDAIGRLGEDPGSRWGTAMIGTLDVTLRRSCALTSGDSDASNAFYPASEGWLSNAAGSFEGLGSHCADFVP